ncbi:flagellar hook capping FlgD N-terminal domain-containing protein [Paenibacillus selenitireducens]|uniref:flagellar hook capping FlgD N-terminal domain-containing protein n=1 Tax=Paenibacillus selenitireducens TaxID=1324314 RepID=UPI0009978566|nr:flagellar hook capping FlgD N-terminal domain-containing protein [Paenibacillus selenitireducens]
MANDNVSTSNIWPNYSPGNVAAAAKKPQSSLGKDDFFKILITQMTNQDPTQPLNDREMIAQMAQFSSVEQLMNISNVLTSMQQSLGGSSGLIGKQISWTTTGATPEKKTGVVESIIVRDGVQYAKVGEDEVLLSKVEKIENPVATEKPEQPQPEQPEQPGQPGQPGQETDKPAESTTPDPTEPTPESPEVSGS